MYADFTWLNIKSFAMLVKSYSDSKHTSRNVYRPIAVGAMTQM